MFTYHLKQDLPSRMEARQAAEKPKQASGEDTPVPSWETLRAEQREAAPTVMVVVRDAAGEVIRRG